MLLPAVWEILFPRGQGLPLVMNDDDDDGGGGGSGLYLGSRDSGYNTVKGGMGRRD
jgi:hypothetical protein